MPLATDCSGFATLCYSWAGAPNPNAAGAYDARQPAFTGSMLGHMRKIPKASVQPGDLVIWTPPGRASTCASWSAAAPTRCSSRTATTRARRSSASRPRTPTSARHGHGTAIWLTAF